MHGVLVDWADKDEQLEGHTFLLTLGKDKTVGETVQLLGIGELFSSFDSLLDFLEEGRSGYLIRVSVLGSMAAAFDLVDAGLDCKRKLNNQPETNWNRGKARLRLKLTVDGPLVKFHEVNPVLRHVQFMAVRVVFRSKEDANHGLGVLVAVDGDVVSEGLVVQTVLADLDVQVLCLLVGCDWKSVGDFGVKVVEESGQLVNDNGFDLDTWEDELVVGVRREMRFEPGKHKKPLTMVLIVDRWKV